MADNVRVDIKDALIISALNRPGGGVNDWRNGTEEQLLARCYATSPVNDRLDAVHRGGVVGVYKASWVTRRQGNGHRVGFQIENFSDHAIYVEEGRGPSHKFQTFSWTRWGGEIRSVGGRAGGRGTFGRDGKHILRDATNSVMATRAEGYVPLV
jgi:hypothetical protein